MDLFDPQQNHRRSIRLKGYDYTQVGAYFVTAVTWHRDCLFGDFADGEVQLNRAGQIIRDEWMNLAQRFKFVELGAFVVMPNHLHGILLFHGVGATRPVLSGAPSGQTLSHHETTAGIDGSPLPSPRGPNPASLGALIGEFKSRATKRLWKIPSLTRTPIWQRNYYERILRNEKEVSATWDYIESNPSLWDDDDENQHKTVPAGS